MNEITTHIYGNNLNHDRIVYSSSLTIIIIIFWIGQIYASVDPQINLGFHEVFTPLQILFGSNPAFGRSPLFDLVVVLISIILLLKFPIRFKQTYIIQYFLLSTLLVTILTFLNPNNNSEASFFSLISSRMGRSLIIIIPFSYALLTLSKLEYQKVIFTIFKIGLVITLSRAVLSILFFISGNGATWAGRNTTNIQGDFLIWLAIFHVICFSIYLYSGKREFLYYNLIILFCLVFSFRRSALLLSFFTDALIYLFYLYKIDRNYKRKFKQMFFVFIFIVFVFPYLYTKSKIVFDFTNRYASALTFTGLVDVSDSIGNKNKGEYTDSGHLNQSLTTTYFFLDNLDRFWGTGLRTDSRVFWVEGRSEGGVHNNIVYAWSRYGMYMVFFLGSFLFIFLNLFRKFFKNPGINLVEFLVASIVIFQVNYLILGWFAGGVFFSCVQYATQFILLFSVQKLVKY
ncbi:MAG: hypothetical protein DWQ05_13165 [Calditrichaeota bacterium]|nr:MAG: hypothetical protein DWQ05_13165 [Calditrichota bacterium]